MNLSVKQRGLLLAILPQSGKRVEMLLINEMVKSLSFTPEEREEFELRDTEVGTTFNPIKVRDITFDFSDIQKEIVKTTLLEMDKNAQISLDLLPIWDMFFGVNQL
ncbi:MAG TPA: hypothetical protein VF602_09440 [Pedobacter sp.]|jgi:hypothetical protein